MSTEHIVSLLILERSRLQAAIDALGGDESNVPEWVLGRKVPQESAERTPAQKSHSERMKENWAKRKAIAVTVTPVAASAKRQGSMSAAGRKAVGEATRARWAALRAAKANSTQPKKKTKSAIVAEVVAPTKEDVEFKSKMSIAMAKSWKKRKAAGKNQS